MAFLITWCPLTFSAQASEQDSSVSLVFAGDIVLDDTAGAMIERGEDPFSGLADVFAGADAVIGGHPHVTQKTAQYKGKPIIYSVGNFIMKETDNAEQRRGWVLRQRHTASTCWRRGDTDARLCTAN